MADEAPEKISINGQEYNPEEAQEFIELGRRAKQIESDLSTSLDKVYPEFTKTRQELKGIREEKEKIASEFAEFQRAHELEKAKKEVPEDADVIRGNARKYGILTEDAAKEKGYMTKAEVEEYMTQQENKQMLISKVNQEADALTEELTGKDGRAKFNKKATMAYAATYGFQTLREAYDDMNADSLKEYQEKEIAKSQRPGLTTLKGGVKSKEPEKPKITNDNWNQLWDELLTGQE